MPAQPNHIRAFELRLEANWSSEDVVQMLTSDFVDKVLLPGFPALEPTIKMRALIAFLGIRTEQHRSLRRHLPEFLRVADDDKDEWVQVVSGLVRNKLLLQQEREEGLPGAADAADNITSTTILNRTVADVLTRAKRIIDDPSNGSGGGGTADGGTGSASTAGSKRRLVGEAPYFGPVEERYVSRKQQPPKDEFENVHFNARGNTFDDFSEDLASSWHPGAAAASSASNSPPNAGATAGFRATPGGLMKPPAPQSQPASSTGPNLAQARRVNLTAMDPSAGSDGRRRTSKPMALAHSRGVLQRSTGGSGHHLNLGVRKAGGGGGNGARGARGNVGGAGGRKMGVMMINVDELQAIEAEKESAREKAKGRPGRKKAKVTPSEEENPSAGSAASGEVGGGSGAGGAINSSMTTEQASASSGIADGRAQDSADGAASWSEGGRPQKPSTPPEAPTIPGAGEIDAVAAMMGLGVAGAPTSAAEEETSYLPPALTAVLATANSLSPDGMEKLQKYFRKEPREGPAQERVKYHEEVTTAESGEQTRVTSYIRLDYDTWMWDRVHKKKKVK